MSPKQILNKYWGYNEFRPGQLEAIETLVSRESVAVLFPTGGGKSLIYQVAGLYLPGMTIVVSPLISLIVDQVSDLRRRRIQAEYIDSQKDKKDILRILENARLGHVKFLYVAPERFLSPIFLEKLKYLPVEFFAIDEAHCVSTWGHDFRPAYLSLRKIKEYKKDATICCLTATATPKVLDDIIGVFDMDGAQVFRKSFLRKNISINMVNTEQKFIKLKNTIKQIDGSTIIYCRSRRNTEAISKQLSKHGIDNRYYHAGLAYKKRMTIQKDWMIDRPNVIVATTAFGMGIDKSDVRLVCHVDIPNSLEDYYQEIGRAGRDGEYSNAVLFYSDKDIELSQEKLRSAFPPKEQLSKVLQSLYRQFNLAYGEGFGYSSFLDFSKWLRSMDSSASKIFQALNLLQKSGWITLDQNYKQQSTVKVVVERYLLDRVEHLEEYDHLIKHLLRHHEGLFYSYVRINIPDIAEAINTSKEKVHIMLSKLHKNEFIRYYPEIQGTRIHFLKNRPRNSGFVISPKYYEERKEFQEKQLLSVFHLMNLKTQCRQSFLLEYFGEESSIKCGICDICRSSKTNGSDLEKVVIEKIKHSNIDLITLVNSFPITDQDEIKKIIQGFERKELIQILPDMQIMYKQNSKD